MANFFSPDNTLFLLLVALWTLPWKGVALWKASKRSEKKWFIALLIINTLAILEILYIFYFSKRPPKNEVLDKPAPKLEDHPEKEGNKQKILEAVHEWKKINPNTVGRLLNVSDMVAVLYLEELAQEKKIEPTYESEEELIYRLRS